jgi:hypothetical protein
MLSLLMVITLTLMMPITHASDGDTIQLKQV